jgi:hypothetical protein
MPNFQTKHFEQMSRSLGVALLLCIVVVWAADISQGTVGRCRGSVFGVLAETVVWV